VGFLQRMTAAIEIDDHHVDDEPTSAVADSPSASASASAS